MDEPTYPRGHTVAEFIRSRVRPRRHAAASPEEKSRPSLSRLGREAVGSPRALDHRLAGRQNWQDHEIVKVSTLLRTEPAELFSALKTDRAAPGALRSKRGQPKKVGKRLDADEV